ncbi:hypothetical protein H072_2337 [Dactylellina haptotyla CBS 200.50]|uniref:Uncharacterized protein n=1 Tax=Dactylellina haptotyla (strain CBS 200.50) TaxID=1284197 RepID=S8AL54_DACHA|nr:hypothetical protein H072_2337 [Dactylellina haptotyla CBS 200.50]
MSHQPGQNDWDYVLHEHSQSPEYVQESHERHNPQYPERIPLIRDLQTLDDFHLSLDDYPVNGVNSPRFLPSQTYIYPPLAPNKCRECSILGLAECECAFRDYSPESASLSDHDDQTSCTRNVQYHQEPTFHESANHPEQLDSDAGWVVSNYETHQDDDLYDGSDYISQQFGADTGFTNRDNHEPRLNAEMHQEPLTDPSDSGADDSDGEDTRGIYGRRFESPPPVDLSGRYQYLRF